MPLSHDAPPSSPSLDQQRDALRKGLGRALQWAMAGRLDDAPLLEACVKDLRYDGQLEEPRGEWLWRMIQEVGAVDRFRVPILHALHELSDERSAEQLCELARCYAGAGDQTFRTRLYEIVEQKPITASAWLGEQEIIGLDGEEAFLFAARIRGEKVAGREWEWDDGSLVGQAVERFGEERVNGLLDDASDGAIVSFRTAWRRQKEAEAGRKPSLSRRERMQAITVEEILLAAESDEPDFHFFRGWGMFADEADLKRILRHLRSARDPEVVVRLLHVFSNRPMLQFDEHFIHLARNDDDEVRRRAIIALEKVQHPLVRELALAELERGPQGVGLLVRNFQMGDEHHILGSLPMPDDCELHGFLWDVIEVLKANAEADCSPLGVLAYARLRAGNADAGRSGCCSIAVLHPSG